MVSSVIVVTQPIVPVEELVTRVSVGVSESYVVGCETRKGVLLPMRYSCIPTQDAPVVQDHAQRGSKLKGTHRVAGAIVYAAVGRPYS